jgi:hypothetical protein
MECKRGHQHEKWGLEWDGMNLHKKSSKKHSWIRIADRDTGTGSLVRVVKKVQKLRTVIIEAGSANLRFESGYSWKLRCFYTPSSQTSLNWRENWSQARKKRKNTIGEEIEKGEHKNHWRRNCQRWREIIDLLGVFFSLLFSHVVMLFEHESLCNIWHNLLLDTLLGV